MRGTRLYAVAAAIGVAAGCGSSEGEKPNPPNDTAGEGGEGQTGGSGGTAAGARGGSSGAGRGGTSGQAGAGEGSGGTETGGGGAAGDSGSGGDPSGESGSGGEPTTTTVTLAVSAASDVHPISPLVYGINRGSASCSDAGARFALCRLGGNAWSTYNWENNASNAGGDRCHENNADLGSSATPALTVTELVAEADTVDATSVVTVPMLDYVAADKTSGTPPPGCSGDVRTQTDYLATRFKVNRSRKGSALATTPDTADDYVNQDEFVSFVRTAANGAPLVFALDNQPELWPSTHPAVHPGETTYAEVVSKTVEYATMVRDNAPGAEIASYVGYGYAGFVSLQEAPDHMANGEFLDYFLEQMSAAGTAAGRRLVDYLDVHWYSEVYVDNTRILGEEAAPEIVAARVQAPRSLWDPTYVEYSWIAGFLGNAPIRLIPWLKEKIVSGYPGTKLAISEWNYGGGTHVSGAIAAADALGIFGREGVDLAAWVSLGDDDPYVLGAFRAYRNYDGAGAAFGDRSVGASSSDDEAASVYASIRSTDADSMVIVAINKGESVLEATLEIDHTAQYASARVYALTSTSPVPTRGTDLTAQNRNEFIYRMPAFSVSVIVPGP